MPLEKVNEVTVQLLVPSEIVTVPVGAVFRRGEEFAVFVDRNGSARLLPVQVGRRNGLQVQILSGLKPGDRVVVHPSDRVSEGRAIAAR